MGLSDKAEAVKDVQESNEAKGGEGVERTVAEAHSDKALSALLDKKTGDYIAQKTNIEQVKVDDKTVNLTDGKHERERGAIKDAAKAMATGDMDAVKKAFDGLSPEQAKTVAAGLDKALRPGVAVNYDGDSNSIDFYTNPARVGNARSDKVMVPTDGGNPKKGHGDQDILSGAKLADAKPDDLKKVVADAVKGDAARKDSFGMTMSKSDASPALFKSDVAEAKGDPPPPPDFQVYSGREIKTADLAKEDIKYEQEKRGTYVEFPNGVHVDMLKERTTTVTVDGEKPTTHVHPAEVRIEGAKEQPEGSGKYVDAKGHQVAKQMEDGSVRVWTGKGGGVYNVYPDGHVTKETAAWNREKNTWDIIDDKNTLGDPMRKQMDKP